MGFDIISLFKDEVQMAEEDLVAMEFALEDYYSERVKENQEYYSQDQKEWNVQSALLLREIDKLNDEFIQKEEYEKCSVVKKVEGTIKKLIDEGS